MVKQIEWEDLIYCSKGKLSLTSEGQFQLSPVHRADPKIFILDLLKSAEEAQRRNNALLPASEYSSSFSQSILPKAYYDSDLKENLDVVRLSIQIAVKEDQQIIKGL